MIRLTAGCSLLGAIGLSLIGCTTPGPHERYAATVAQGLAENRKVAPAGAVLGELSDAEAYAVQDRLVARLSGDRGIAGLKGGNMAPGAGPPIYGVLLRSGERPPAETLRLSDFRLLALETEIGFVMGRRIDARIDDIESLKGAVRSIVPAVELPDFPFQSIGGLKSTDIIAANVAARAYVVGAPAAGRIDPNLVEVRLTYQGTEVNRGQGSALFGDQWRALQWIVNASVARGRPIEPGFLIITGTLGRAVPAKAGRYRADYGALGAIEFEIVP